MSMDSHSRIDHSKVIIIAASMGNRLTPLTNDKPKCMLKIGNKTIMQLQLDVLRQCGVDNIVR